VGLVVAATASLALWVHQDLARLEAETHQRRLQLEAQLERSRRVLPTFSALAASGMGGDFEERRAIRDEVTGLLNRIAVERRRHHQASARLSARLHALPWSLLGALLPDRSHEGAAVMAFPESEQLVDPTRYLSAQQAAAVEEQLRLLKLELKVDARVLFVTPPADESFEDFGARVFESLDATGSGPGERGLLLLVDVPGGRSRIELGYALEPHLFDSMAGALAREHLNPADMNRFGLDLRLILRVLRLRLRNALLAGSFPPLLAGDVEGQHGAGGAGGSALLGDPTQTLPIPLERGARMAYSAGSSVRETYSRYLHWLQNGGFDLSVGMFTAGSRALLSRWRATPVYLDLMSRSHLMGPVAVIEREQSAMLYALADPLAPPHFFQRTSHGWQINLAAREHHVLAIAGGPFTWTLRRIEVAPLVSFRADLEAVEGLIRIRGGANRPLPSDSSPGGTRIASFGS